MNTKKTLTHMLVEVAGTKAGKVLTVLIGVALVALFVKGALKADKEAELIAVRDKAELVAKYDEVNYTMEKLRKVGAFKE
jgi:hypothetical protein